jgi:hypothetical protein
MTKILTIAEANNRPENSPLVQHVGDRVAQHLAEIAQMFKAGAKLTVLVRHPGNPDADMLVSDDSFNGMLGIIRRRKLADDGQAWKTAEGKRADTQLNECLVLFAQAAVAAHVSGYGDDQRAAETAAAEALLVRIDELLEGKA